MGPTWVTYEDVIDNILRHLSTAPRGTKKRLAAACGMDHAEFRHRMTQRNGRSFEIRHLGAIGAASGLPPPWPFVDKEEAIAFRAFVEMAEAVSAKTSGKR